MLYIYIFVYVCVCVYINTMSVIYKNKQYPRYKIIITFFLQILIQKNETLFLNK